jgi:hypothetical protein
MVFGPDSFSIMTNIFSRSSRWTPARSGFILAGLEEVMDDSSSICRLFKKAVQQGRSE